MMHRRQLLVGTSGVLLAGLCFPRDGQAQAPAQPRPAQATAALEARARRLGIPTPVGDAARIANRSAQDQDAYGELLPRLVDIIVRADQARGPAPDVAETAA